MKQNPCRYCHLAIEYKGHKTANYYVDCKDCEYRIKHEEYLQEHRKFRSGEVISSLDELLEQTWVMWRGDTKHIEVIKSLQLRTVIGLLNGGVFRKAVENSKGEVIE